MKARLVLATLFPLLALASPLASSVRLARAAPPAPPADTAVVELIEVGDLECPFCARAQDAVDAVREKYGAKLTHRWLHNPLPFHASAGPAALALEAARRQGKLDAMVALTFAHQQDLSPAALRRYALKAGVDGARFDKDLVDPTLAAAVDREQRIAIAVGATGTPTFFVNGHKIPGAVPAETFEAAIDAELAEAGDRAGAEWRKARLAAVNRDLHDYLYAGRVPPAADAAPPKPAADETVYKVAVDPALDAVLGPPAAPVTVVVFTDYQCPFCRKLEPTLAALRARYPSDVRLVVRHNPLPFHAQAMPAAKAAVCAQEQGAFPAMHAAILAIEPAALEAVDFRALAKKARLDLKRYDACVAERAGERVRRDLDDAAAASARGTPNTFVNGRKVTGAKPLDAFAALVDEELGKARARLAAGTRLADLYPAIIADGAVVEPLDPHVRAIDVAGAPRLGPANAKVHVAIFGDFQCPFTAKAFPLLKRLVDAYPGALSVTFHHFPLSFHEAAQATAEAAVCAAQQDRFWPFAEAVFGAQDDLPDVLEAAADKAGIDRTRFAACRATAATGAPSELIERQRQDALGAGVRGTPTIFIEGRMFSPPSGYELVAFESVIDRYFPDAR